MPLTSLKVNESITREIDPGEKHCSTGLAVKAEERYTFKAEGQWLDWYIACGPDGWGHWNPLKFFNRLRGKPFFLLCGNVGKDDRFAFAAYSSQSKSGECEWPVPEEVNTLSDPQLYMFANDWPYQWAYRNNKSLPPKKGGPLVVTITRLK